jgi:hypothetical protein
MIARSLRSVVILSTIAVASLVYPAEDKRHLVDHMQIQIEVTKAKKPPAFTVRVGPITSLVPLNSGWKADEIFAAPFVEELREGIAYYLAQKGIKVVEGAADIQVAGRITTYKGFRGGGEHGADVRMETIFLRHGEKRYEQEVKSLFKYKDAGEQEDRLKPVYKARTGSKRIEFPVILFTRVAAELGEKIYLVLDQLRANLE